MKVILLTTLPNEVASELKELLGDALTVIDVLAVVNSRVNLATLLCDEKPDAMLTYRCPYILPMNIISALPSGAYNLHPSLLPKYKGLNPWQEIFSNKERESGVTLHRITQEIDGGPIVMQRKFCITAEDSITSARNKADKLAAEMARTFFSSYNF